MIVVDSLYLTFVELAEAEPPSPDWTVTVYVIFSNTAFAVTLQFTVSVADLEVVLETVDACFVSAEVISHLTN